MKLLYIVPLLHIIMTFGCSDLEKPKVSKSVKELVNKYPQISSSKPFSSDNYKLVKSVRNGKFNFEIQLLSESDSIKGKQEIIVFINDKNECFAIPFFSNKYKSYWEFPFEKDSNSQKVNTTFSKELNGVLDRLTEKANPKKEIIDHEIITELLFSVLNCRSLKESDSLLIYKTLHMNLDLPVESSDLAFVRLRKNYELMKKDWHSKEYQVNYNCYLDEKNARIYQFQFNEDTQAISVRSYRQDYGFRYLDL